MNESSKIEILRSEFEAKPINGKMDKVPVGFKTVSITTPVMCRIVEYPKLKNVVLHFQYDGHYWPAVFEDWEPYNRSKEEVKGWSDLNS